MAGLSFTFNNPRVERVLSGAGSLEKLAEEIAQWLTIWLQTPQIFSEWLSLRRSTADFQARFHS